MKVQRILAGKPKRIVTIKPHESVRAAVEKLAANRIGALIVVAHDGKLVGILSERDIIRAAATNDEVLNQKVLDIMTRDVVVGVPQDDVMSVAHTMTERRFRHLPIMEEDEIIGMLSIGDILKAQRDVYRGEIDTLETQIMADEAEY